ETQGLHTDELMAVMQREFLTRPMDEWSRLFREADIVSGPMAHFRDVATDEQAWANHFLEDYLCRNGETCIMPYQPIRLDSLEIRPARQAPLPGEQTDAVLRDFGYSEAEIAQLHACRAVQ
ncbi:MAG: CoA transferase, partial [Oscillibacter sp.]|nr:CoA transferase [Oscillibacter sp.]